MTELSEVDREIKKQLDRLDKAMARFDRRRAVFEKEGLSPEEAYQLAERMYVRDRDPFDNRRVCFECTHLEGRKCYEIKQDGKPTEPLRFVLQRCDSFRLKEVA